MTLSASERQRRWRKLHPAEHNARQSEWRRNKTLTIPFVGVDGEGGGKDPHRYYLLRAGGHVLRAGDSGDLSTLECFRFLCGLPKGPKYVAYFFDYDVTMILRDLPGYKVHRLLHRDERPRHEKSGQSFPVDWKGYEFDYLPRKEFKIRRKGGHWTVISDVGSFFQTAFIKTLATWEIGSPAQRAKVAEGKDQRHDFVGWTEYIDEYNALECELLADLMDQFRTVCYEAGYVPGKWQGPGNLAVAMFKAHGIPRTKDLPKQDTRTLRMGQAAYIGGRFEISAVGEIPGPVYQYDINSAYPDALRHLPCLEHGKWHAVKESDLTGIDLATELLIGRWHFMSKPETFNLWYDLPVRRMSGTIVWPATGFGHYWSPEVNQAIRHHQVAELIGWGRLYERRCSCEPFGWIAGVYEERKRLGKTGKGKILKLGLNSLYGKTCQSVGMAPYANPIWASLITSYTRARLSELMHSGGNCCEDVYMVATDGVFTGMVRPVVPNGLLGGWDLQIHPKGMFVVQPGMYFLEGSGHKTRGVPLSTLSQAETRFRDTWSEWIGRTDTSHMPSVTVELETFTGIRLAAARHRLNTAGRWTTTQKELSFDWRSKRQGIRLEDSYVSTAPQYGGQESVPYSRDIGRMMEDQRLDWADQPDWAEKLIEEREEGNGAI